MRAKLEAFVLRWFAIGFVAFLCGTLAAVIVDEWAGPTLRALGFHLPRSECLWYLAFGLGAGYVAGEAQARMPKELPE